MTVLTYLNLETLVIESKESTRDYMDLLDSAQKYTHKKFAGREAAIQFMIDNNAPLVSYDYLTK